MIWHVISFTDGQKFAILQRYLNFEAVIGPGEEKAKTLSLEYHCDVRLAPTNFLIPSSVQRLLMVRVKERGKV